MKFKILNFILSICLVQIGIAQRSVSGTVMDADSNEPLIGANILVKGTANGTITDVDGTFSLEVPEGYNTLSISYIGFVEQEIDITNQSSIEVLLTGGSNLDEVVVIGYTSQKKKDITGAITSVDIEEIETLPAGNVAKNLQGRLPGVQITTTGNPNSSAGVIIRGQNVNGNDPLYVIDGVPTLSGLQELNGNDIESIQVLRDAASASIYGARARNGVIIITTKKGQEGAGPQFHIRANTTVEDFAYNVSPLNTEQRAQSIWQGAVNDGTNPNAASPLYSFDWNGDFNNPQLNQIFLPEFIDGAETMRPANTDWFNEITQNSVIQDYHFDVSNNHDKGYYYFSAGLYDAQGVVKESNFERLSMRMNSMYELSDNVRIGQNFTATNQTANLVNDIAQGAINLSIEQQTIVPIFTEEGGWGGPTGGITDRDNPVRLIEMNKDNESNYNKLLGNAFIEYDPIENLTLRSSIGGEFNFYNFRNFTKAFTAGSLNFEDQLTETNFRNGSYTWTNTANYTVSISDKQNLNLLAGSEAIRFSSSISEGIGSGFASQDRDFARLSNATEGVRVTGSGEAWTLFSLFAKASYDFDNKYLFSATIRRDGSSRFGENNQYGIFPAFTAGWRLSEEKFMKEGIFDDLKVRASWGQNGFDQVPVLARFETFSPLYATQSLFGGAFQDNGTAYDITGADAGTLPSGFTKTQTGNPDIKWETTTMWNVGFDFSVLNYKLYGAFDYFVADTDDILSLTAPLATQGEGAQRWINDASTRSKGWEVTLGYINELNLSGENLTINLNANLSSIDNEVLSGSDESLNFINRNHGFESIIGQPWNQPFGYEADGLFQSQAEVDAHATQPGAGLGRIRFRDLNSDGVINADDQTFIGNPNPDLLYGLNAQLGYKGFDIAAFFQGVVGGQIRNGWKSFTDFTSFNVGSNYGSRVLDAWTPTNTESTIPALSLIDRNNEGRQSTYFFEPADYLKLRNITLGYDLSRSVFPQMQHFRVFIQGQNLFTVKSGDTVTQDPEAPAAIFPIPKRLTVGLDITF